MSFTGVAITATLLYISSVIHWWLRFEDYKRHDRWQQHIIEELEADKRALTESLCRAQGKPYISNEKREFRPSEGWFDGQPRIEVKN